MMVTGMDDDQTCVRERERGWEVVCIRRFFSCDGRSVGWLVGRVGLFVLFYGIIKRGVFFFRELRYILVEAFLVLPLLSVFSYLGSSCADLCVSVVFCLCCAGGEGWGVSLRGWKECVWGFV